MTTTHTTTAKQTEVPTIVDVEELARQFSECDFSPKAFEALEHRGAHRDAAHLLFKVAQARAVGTAELAAALSSVWAANGMPTTLLSVEQWRSLFAAHGYTRDGVTAKRPVGSLRLYRGAPAEGKLGMSWTFDPDVAEFYSSNWEEGEDDPIWTAVFEPEHLLACITWRNEAEFVVDPGVLASGLIEVERYSGA